MTCSETRDLLSAWLDQALDAHEREQVEAHLASCPECRRELEGLRSTVTVLSRVEHPRAPVGFVDRVMGEVYPAPWYRKLGRLVFQPLSVKLPLEAGAMVVIAILGVYLLQGTPEMKDAARPDVPAVAPRPDSPPVAPPAPLPQAPAPSPSTEGAARLEKGAPPAAREERERDNLARRPDQAQAPAEMNQDVKKESTVKAEPPATEPEKPETPAARSPAPRALDSRESSRDRFEEDRKSAQGAVPARPALPLAPAAPSVMSTKQLIAPMVSGALTVKDRPQAERDLANLISRTGAREIARRQEGNATIVDVVVPQAGYADFRRELGGLGALRLDGQPDATAALVRLAVRISE
jgi:pyruvate/2-oxoglutarate dehydrogenase complex dihydrolipoamide acyltransferase (E2) component